MLNLFVRYWATQDLDSFDVIELRHLKLLSGKFSLHFNVLIKKLFGFFFNHCFIVHNELIYIGFEDQ